MDPEISKKIKKGNKHKNGADKGPVSVVKEKKKTKEKKEAKRASEETPESMELVNGKKKEKKKKETPSSEETNGKKHADKKRKREQKESEMLASDFSREEGKKQKKEVALMGYGIGTESFRKNFYKEHASLKSFSKEAVEQFRLENGMSVSGSDVRPIRTFDESGFPSEMLVSCKSFSKPTPIQSQCWPIVLSGHDVIGIAETGSGKCLGRGTPILMYDGTVKPVQDVKVGEQLMGDDSTPRKVLSLARGREDMARIRLEKGGSFTCNMSHVLSLKIGDCPGYRYDNTAGAHCAVIPMVERNGQGIVIGIKYATMQFANELEAKGVLADFGWSECALKSREEEKDETAYNRKDGEKRKGLKTVEPNRAVENLKNKIKAITGVNEVILRDETIEFLKRNEGNEVILRDETIDIAVKDLVDPKKVFPAIFAQLKSYHVGSLKFPPRDQPLPIDPYALGYWLGDGILRPNGQVTKGTNEFLNCIKARELGPVGKHIPDEYKLGSEQTRLQLLAGLIDADGHLNGNSFDLCLKNKTLLEDAVFVARSLGLHVTRCRNKWVDKIRQSDSVRGKKHGDRHRICISGAIDRLQCMSLPKQAVALNVNKEVLLEGFEIDLLAEDDFYGFTLDGNSRFVIGDIFVVTHNTIAFTLPALVHIKDQKPVGRNQGPVALILSPTRELAMQIAEVCVQSGKPCGIRTACIYGGVDKGPQKRALEEGCHIVVATPGRLMDLVNQEICSLDRVTYLVMDEADRMLDLGFEKDIRGIVSQIRSDRQTLMFSATWPQAIQKLAEDYLQNAVKVTIGSEDLTANHKVKQIVEVIDSFARDNRLDQLLKQYHKSRTNRILIFVLYKKEASRVERMLQGKGWKAQALHGDVSQAERTRAMKEFKDGTQPLLVATDVAARGLDIPNVEYVINYSFPLTIEDYIHRIGRTGRGGKTGISHTLFTAADKTKGGELVQVLREANQEVPEELLKFGIVTKKKEHALYGSAFKEQRDNTPMPKSSHIKFD